MQTSMSCGAVSLHGLITGHIPLCNSGLGQEPLMLFLIMKLPNALRSSHHIEVIEIIAVKCCTRVITLGHERHVSVLHGDRFIDRTVLGVDALKGKALSGLDTVIIDFLEP